MSKEEFIEKWLVGYESLEQKLEFEIEMKSDLASLKQIECCGAWVKVILDFDFWKSSNYEPIEEGNYQGLYKYKYDMKGSGTFYTAKELLDKYLKAIEHDSSPCKVDELRKEIRELTEVKNNILAQRDEYMNAFDKQASTIATLEAEKERLLRFSSLYEEAATDRDKYKALTLKAFETASVLSKKGKIFKIKLTQFEKENNIEL